MKWFLKKKIKSEKDYEKAFSKCEHTRKILLTLNLGQAEKILTLEKESVYWKEKALNFRRFHQ